MQFLKMRNGYSLIRSLGYCSRYSTSTLPSCPNYLSVYGYISNPTSVSLSSALQYYINCSSPNHGAKIHAYILKVGFLPNTNVAIKLLITHLRCGCLDYARKVFDEIPQPTRSAYNYLMDGYVKHRRFEELFDLVRGMRVCDEKPDGFTYSLILKAWVSGSNSLLMQYDFGRQVHAQMVNSDLEEDVILYCSLLDAYVKCRKVDRARKVFDKMPVTNVMCSTSLITGYMNEGRVEDAEDVFEKMVDKDVVVFNAMIEGYSKSIETAKKSVEMYIDMKRFEFRPTVSTFASLVGACSLMAAVEIGQQVQSQLMKTEHFMDIKVASALIDMYSKCGRVDDAWEIFDYMPMKNVFSWTSMIDGYGKNGKPSEALELFGKMQEGFRVKPNHITFLSVLSACAHNGLVNEGTELFRSMERDHCLKPKMEHYACMVDLLGRFGSVNRAWEFVKGMPERPNSDVWAALLSSCRLHGEVEIANMAADELFKLDADARPGAYVSLSNTLASVGQWSDVDEIRKRMKMRRISKDTGFTWVGNGGNLERFHVE